jgi:hypothetical protein
MNLRSLFSLFSSDLAIDLGTANTLVFANDAYPYAALVQATNGDRYGARAGQM